MSRSQPFERYGVFIHIAGVDHIYKEIRIDEESSLISLFAGEAAANAERACGGNCLANFFGCQPGFSGIASEPFTEKIIQRCIFRFGSPAGALDKGIIRAESHISHISRRSGANSGKGECVAGIA